MGYPINTKVPCFNCSNRSMTCHSECEKYIKYSRQRTTIRANIQKERKASSEFHLYRTSTFERKSRNHGVYGAVGQR
jgi:hypothetical protein